MTLYNVAVCVLNDISQALQGLRDKTLVPIKGELSKLLKETLFGTLYNKFYVLEN